MSELIEQMTLGIVGLMEEGEQHEPPLEYWHAKYRMCHLLADKQEEAGDSLGATKNYMRAIRALQMIEGFKK